MNRPTNRLFQTLPLGLTARRACLAVATIGLVALLAGPVPAQDEPGGRVGELEGNVSLPRMPSISPDGETIVFSYHGDLWKVPAAGGNAIRLTSHPAEESWTQFSPDGQQIAFNSDRRGSTGLFTMQNDGTGVVEVLAFDRGALLTDWAEGEDGEILLFTGSLEPDIYRSPRPYVISAGGGVYHRLHDAFGRSAVKEPGGDRYLFVRGGASWNRRHYRGPDTRDVWLYDPDAEEPFIQLTDWDGNDGRPRWAGEDKFVYTSDREDRTVNLYLVDLSEGDDAEENARRLTDFDDRDVEDFDVTPDGSKLVFARWDELHTLDLTEDDAEPQMLSMTAAEDAHDKVEYVSVDNRVSDAAVSPDGKTMAFTAYGQLYVRGTDDNAASRRISATLANFTDIAWSPDGGTLYFVSDESGRDAIYAVTATRTRSEIVEQVEAFHDDNGEDGAATGPATQPATQPATDASDDNRQRGQARADTAPDPGKWPDAITFNIELVSESEEGDSSPVPAHDAKHLAFARGVGDLWVLNLETGDAHRVFNGWSRGLSYIWTYDNEHLLFTTDDADFNTDIWATRADGTGWRGEGEPVNISRHPEGDSSMSISQDNRVLTFASSRGGGTDVYRVYLDEELEALAPIELEEYYESLAQREKQRKVPGVPQWAKQRGTVSPLVGELATRPTGEEGEEDAVEAATRRPRDEGPATQPGTRRSGQSATTKAGGDDPKQTFSINQLRRALRDFILADEDEDEDEDERPKRDAKPAEPQPTLDDLPLERAYLRLDEIGSGNRPLLLPNASAVYYVSSGGTYRRPWDGNAQRIGDAVSLRGMTPKGDKIFYTSGGRGGYFDTSGSRAHRQQNLNPDDRLEVDLAEMNEQKFLSMARTLGDQFYHPTMKDLPWGELTKQYLPLARAARTADEFQHVAMRLLGELNGSHLGVYPPSRWSSDTRQSYGHLGIRSEPTEDGFRVTHVTETGPAGRGPMRLMEGDVITHLELDPVVTDRPLEVQLADRVGREIVVGIRRNGRDLELLIEPVSYGRISRLSYENWRNENHRKVEELSDGRLGYIHIRGMDEGSLETFVRDLYAAAAGKEGLVVDVRNNGGGWTTDRLLASIMYPQHAFTIPRGMEDSRDADRVGPEFGGYPNDRLFIPRYSLPMNMLCNEKSFSNAEIISHAFKTLDRGTLVGQETAGGVISTGAFSLVDGTRVRLPFRGWYLPDGTDMENNGAVPDILVEQTPEAEAAGEDEQLQAAVEDLLSRLPERVEE